MTNGSLASVREALVARISTGERLWLFLDYDGTLADFADTPDEVYPDEELIALLQALVDQPQFRIAVISGRRLSHIRKLLPVSGLLRAGTYGIELDLPGNGKAQHLDYGAIRPVLEEIKSHWQRLLQDREGFYLEDKGWTLAIHAKFAKDQEAAGVLDRAKKMLLERLPDQDFRILGGHKFLEVGPQRANKAYTVDYLMDQYGWPGALPVYIGDDDKDEQAFEAIKAHGGLALVVAKRPRPTLADARLENPQAVRFFLQALLSAARTSEM
jgi:trehalose 6-phosphate phosphatase